MSQSNKPQAVRGISRFAICTSHAIFPQGLEVLETLKKMGRVVSPLSGENVVAPIGSAAFIVQSMPSKGIIRVLPAPEKVTRAADAAAHEYAAQFHWIRPATTIVVLNERLLVLPDSEERLKEALRQLNYFCVHTRQWWGPKAPKLSYDERRALSRERRADRAYGSC